MIMKSRLVSVCIVAALSLIGTSGFARALNTGRPVQAPSTASYKTEANDCVIPSSQYYLDINNVRTTILDAGDLWYNLTTQAASYEVPKGDRTSSTAYPQAIFAGAIWVSGLDQGNNLKIAALTYRTVGTDYWSGPLDNSGSIGKATCSLWDQQFPVWATQIKPLVNTYQAALLAAGGNPAGITIPVASISDSVLYWPGKGNPNLAAKGYDVSNILAPFYDADGDGNYDPTKGDYPTIKQGGTKAVAFDGYCGKFDTSTYTKNTAYADEMIFWVTNDKGNVHGGTAGGTPIGIQINNLAFGFQSSDEINNMTFYTYNIINKSGAVLNQTYMSQYVDPDLGCPNNDRVGCDTTRSLGIVYNGVPQGANNTPGYNYVCDQGNVCISGTVGYGCDLPMLGIDFFEGPTDTTTLINPTTHLPYHKKLGLTSFVSYNNADNPQGDPVTAVQFRNYQTGFWRDGTPITYGGNGYQNSPQRTPFMFPGDPSISTQWSECNPQIGGPIYAADRRFVQTSGPFVFLPCASQSITVGVVFVQPTGGVGSNCPSFSLIAGADDKAQALFDAGFQQLEGPSAPLLSIRELNQQVIINVVDDPTGNNIGESYSQPDPLRVRKGFVTGSNLDSSYSYQGYIVYQLSDATVSANDLTNPSKAVPIAIYDISDNVKHLVNWTQVTDAVTGIQTWQPSTSTVPGVGNDLPNLGIKHSLVDSLDVIGGGQMVNHLTYYFGVIAFATNQFAPFNPNTGLGQYQPFLIGKNFNKYSAIPSDPTSENGGRKLNSAWGNSSAVNRLEGQGNGGNYIDITPATISKILSNPLNYTDTLDYTVGADPIDLKITDPILLQQADFELTIYDTVPYNGVNVSTSAYWILRDVTNGVAIHSVRTLDRPYEQIIADSLGTEYGFSITLGTPFPVYTNYLDSLPVYGAISGSITFQDSTQPWLSFVKDTSVTDDVRNWIRAGQNYTNCSVQAGITPDALCNVFSDGYYFAAGGFHFTDPSNLYSNLAGGRWAPYCLTSNWCTSPLPNGNILVSTNHQPVPGRPKTVGGPAFKWNNFTDTAAPPRDNLDRLQSVNIVLTSDKSKWSRCAVFETGETPTGGNLDPSSNGIAPRKGMLRAHYSVDINGNPGNNPLDIGLSYFPGYAINVETGQRLEVAFGEASDERDQNGTDLIWNPTSQILGSLSNGGAIPYYPYFGGRHYLYVLDIPYPSRAGGVDSGGLDLQGIFEDPTIYQTMVNNPVNQPYPDTVIKVYDHIIWTAMPYLTQGYTMNSMANGLIPNDVTIKLRVQKPYAKFGTVATPSSGDSLPRYSFSTKGLGVTQHNDSIAKTALDRIRIVPNPYYAYSAYEQNANDGRIKVTNLPNVCTIKIYTLDGVLVRTLTRSIGLDPTSATPKAIEISDGYNLNDNTGSSNIDNTVDWDLKNEASIPVASGIYIFDINAPGVGHKTLKWFGAMRPIDISNF